MKRMRRGRRSSKRSVHGYLRTEDYHRTRPLHKKPLSVRDEADDGAAAGTPRPWSLRFAWQVPAHSLGWLKGFAGPRGVALEDPVPMKSRGLMA